MHLNTVWPEALIKILEGLVKVCELGVMLVKVLETEGSVGLQAAKTVGVCVRNIPLCVMVQYLGNTC